MKYPFASAFRVVSPYGERTDPFTGLPSWHSGVDLYADDTAVRAVLPGTAVRSRIVTDPSDRTSEWGNYVAVESAGGVVIYYCHLASRAVEAGSPAETGGLLGIEGSTGRSTGVHLHFEVRINGVPTNAAAFLGIPNAAGAVIEPEKGSGSRPSDSLPSDWSEEAVTWAVENGILRGDPDGSLRLRDCATREELVTMLWRAWKGGNHS